VGLLQVGFKPHTGKAETMAYAALDARSAELRAAAAACLGCVPVALADPQVWNDMLTGVVAEAGATLRTVSRVTRLACASTPQGPSHVHLRQGTP
jgi:hypothetical protein